MKLSSSWTYLICPYMATSPMTFPNTTYVLQLPTLASIFITLCFIALGLAWDVFTKPIPLISNSTLLSQSGNDELRGKSVRNELIVYLQVIIGDGRSPLNVPPDVLIGIDHNFDGFGTRMASLDHLQGEHRFTCIQCSHTFLFSEISRIYKSMRVCGVPKWFWGDEGL